MAVRQWDEEEKQRQLTPESNGEVDEDDISSTKDGVLHEEEFHEIKTTSGLNGQHDLEQPHDSTPEASLLAVLKIVDWWKVRLMLPAERLRQKTLATPLSNHGGASAHPSYVR